MKRILLMTLLLAAATLTARAGKVVTDSLYSRNLGATVKYNVYLPDGFDKGEKHYPVVYLLHGLYGCYEDWLKLGNMKLVADELIGSGEASEMVIIMPNAGDEDVHNVQNGYFNVEDWPYEDFFFQELMPEAEAKYRCGGAKGQRAVMGLSMGGGGSTVYCQRHPDLFSSCYAMSAWLDNPGGPRGEPGVRDKLTIVSESVREHSALDFIDNADEETVAKMRTVKWFFDCGDDDGLLPLTTELYQKMRYKRIKSELRVRNGVHNWEYWHLALRIALPFASRNFDR